MGMNTAIKNGQILENAWGILGIEMMAAARAFFAAGGLGILIGGGQLLHPGKKSILEIFYAMRVVGHLAVSTNSQCVANPAYIADRSPVSILALRVHAEFRSNLSLYIAYAAVHLKRPGAA
jgi:hypothetical protein